MKRLDERYGIERAIYLSNEWLDKRLETGKRNDAPEIFLKDLLRLKKDFKSGKLAVPVEFISQERKDEKAGLVAVSGAEKKKGFHR